MRSCPWYLWNHFKRNHFSEANFSFLFFFSLKKKKSNKSSRVKEALLKVNAVGLCLSLICWRTISRCLLQSSTQSVCLLPIVLRTVRACAGAGGGGGWGGGEDGALESMSLSHHIQPLLLITVLWTTGMWVSNQKAILLLLTTPCPPLPCLTCSVSSPSLSWNMTQPTTVLVTCYQCKFLSFLLATELY